MGTSRLLGTRLVGSGSGYNSQNVLPVHFGLPDASRVDVEVTWSTGRGRVTMRRTPVDPAAWVGRALTAEVDGDQASR